VDPTILPDAGPGGKPEIRVAFLPVRTHRESKEPMIVKKPRPLPMLSPPWKVGFLAALLVLTMSVGATFYVTRYILGIDLQVLWTQVVDPRVEGYFTRGFPVQAGLLLVCLACYFLFASALRRYRRWVDSGEGYRFLVKKARSLEDLTSPAQIAKFNDYPEFQEILRSWADRMRSGAPAAAQPGEEKGASAAAPGDGDLSGEALRSLESSVQSLSDPDTPLESLRPPGAAWDSFTRTLRNSMAARLGRAAGASARQVETMSWLPDAVNNLRERVDELGGHFERISATLLPLAESCTESMTGLGAGESGREDPPAGGAALESIREVCGGLRGLGERNQKIALDLALKASRGECSEEDFSNMADEVRELTESFFSLAEKAEVSVQDLQTSGTSAGPDRDDVENILMAVEEGVGDFREASDEVNTIIHALQEGLGEVAAVLEKGLPGDAPGATGAGSQEKADSAVEGAGGWGEVSLDGSGPASSPGTAPARKWSADDFGNIDINRAGTRASAPATSPEPQAGSPPRDEPAEGPRIREAGTGAPAGPGTPSAPRASAAPGAPESAPAAAPAEPASDEAGGVVRWVAFSTADQGGDEPVHELDALGAVECGAGSRG
jgi:hypothetical protein